MTEPASTVGSYWDLLVLSPSPDMMERSSPPLYTWLINSSVPQLAVAKKEKEIQRKDVATAPLGLSCENAQSRTDQGDHF